VHPLVLDAIAAARADELRRQAARERSALPLLRPSPVGRVARRSARSVGFLLVRAGLRLAMVGEHRATAGRSVV
jgi:hypothetical protein